MEGFPCFYFSVKSGPRGLSADDLTGDANSFAESGRTAENTAVQNARLLYRKVVFRRFLLILCAFVSLCSIKKLSLTLSLSFFFPIFAPENVYFRFFKFFGFS